MQERVSQSKIPLKQFYRPDDIAGFNYEQNLNDPGQFPFTRGRSENLYAGGTWIQRELSGEGEPTRANEQFKYLIAKGAHGLDVIGDAPTMAGLDPDHPFAANAIGTQGVSVCCLDDFRELYRDIPLDALTLSHSLLPQSVMSCLYLCAKEYGYDPAKLRGSVVQAAFYNEDCGYAIRTPFRVRIRMATDSIEFGTREMPKFHSFIEDTYYISDAGLNSIEEMALGFVEIRYLVRQLLGRGLDIDSFAPRIAILLNCRMDLFEEIAKVRATRRLFARMMRDEFGAKDRRSLSTVITCHTSGLTLTAQQPFNNIVRGALEALAMVLAGAQAIEISAFDEAYRTPSPASHLVGLRTQQVIQMETNTTKVVDPLGGSYYIEALTDELERRIWDLVQKIEAQGDPAKLSDDGWFKRNFFDEAMQRYARELREEKLLKVGVNCFRIPEEEDTLLKEVVETKIEPCFARIDKIKAYKEKRDQGRLRDALQALLEQTRSEKQNITYPIMEAMQSGATMGEVLGVVRLAYGAPYDPFGMVEPPVQL